jgi:demethylmenaquinone methyltransferase / 2-methoxy-6-polyprenyl-1,4-benzoquinol methylase
MPKDLSMDESTPPDHRLALVERFFSGTGDSYDAMVNGATFGIDRLWKRRIVALIPSGAERILDLACGTGISTLAIAKARPDSRIVGVELRAEYLDIARKKIAGRGPGNIELVLSRAEDYTSERPFGCIVSSYLAKYADLPLLCRNARGMLRPGGVFIAHDFTYPPGALRVGLFHLYFKVLQVVGSRLIPSWREIYHGLPELIEATTWAEDLPAALEDAGFIDVRRDDLTLYGSAIVHGRLPG